MPRWVEDTVLLGVGLLVTLGILLFAKLSTQSKPASVSTLDPKGYSTKPAVELKASEPKAPQDKGVIVLASGEFPKTKKSLRPKPPAIDKGNIKKSDPVSPEEAARILRAAGVNLAVVGGKAIDDDIPPIESDLLLEEEQPSSSQSLAGVAASPLRKDDKLTEEDKSKARAKALAKLVAEKQRKASAQRDDAKSRSVNELKLLKKAQASLARLHRLRLRSGLPPAVSNKEAKRLVAIIDQLPPKTRAAVRKAIEAGYGLRAKKSSRVEGVVGENSASADPESRAEGRTDDTPADVRSLKQRISNLRRRMGAATEKGASPVPTATGDIPEVRANGGYRRSSEGSLDSPVESLGP